MLALVGSGEYLPPMEPVDRFLLSRLEEPLRVVCLPTAAGQEGPERIEYWTELGERYFQGLGVEVQTVPILNRMHAHEPRLVEPIRQANFVYLSGGKPDYLYQVLEGTKTWQALLEVHQRGGVLAGCSAGAMIMGERTLGITSLGAGFNLLPGTVILPHFDEFGGWMLRLARLRARGYRLLGIDGDTALVIDGQEQRVVGSGAVTILDEGNEQRYTGEELLPAWQGPVAGKDGRS